MRLLLLALAAVTSARGAAADALDVLRVVRVGGGAALPPVVVATASFGGELPRVAPHDTVAALQLVRAQMAGDCRALEATSASSLPGTASAVLVDRGGPCSFVQKAAAAQRAGASMLVVGDTVQGAYASGAQTGGRIYDCALGEATLSRNATVAYPAVGASEQGLEGCAQSFACGAATCVYTGAAGSGGNGFQVCCFANTLVRMGADEQSLTLASTITIPAIFVSLRDAAQLRELIADHASLSVQAFRTEESPWNVSMLLTWLLGVCIVIGGAYCSATDERRFSYEKVAQGYGTQTGRPVRVSDTIVTQYMSIDDMEQPRQRVSVEADEQEGDDDQDDKVELSAIHAVYFVVGSSSILVLLYYGHLAMLMNVLFMVATTASMMQVVILPVLTALRPQRAIMSTHAEWLLPLISFALAASVSVYWFVHRASANIWPLQDLLCVTLCFVVIDSIQLPSLKVATVLLGVAFAYDVFFVYISPLIFGSSVMIDVASGQGHTQASADVAANESHEKLPMVLSVPLLFSYYGGDALLGLGDLILPGLLVSLCIRYDYCMGHPLSRNYFMVASTSYAAGLLLANVMAVALRDVVQGQPALMYIVPLMLGSISLLAARKRELDELWQGPDCFRMELGLAGEFKSQLPRRGEIEPFLKTR